MSLGLGLSLSRVARGGATAPPEPTERILNTTLDNSDNTAAPQGGWTIAAGVATNTIALRQLQFSLSAPIAAGLVQQAEVTVFTSVGSGVLVEAFATGDSSTFVLIDDASGTSGVKTATNVMVTGGPYDRVRIRCPDDAGTVIDGLSVLA